MTILRTILHQANQSLSKLNPHVVGGAVRDRLLDRPTLDLDLITTRDPHSAALKMAKKLGGSAFRLDEVFGITRIKFPGGLQLDLSKIQGKNVETDLHRRDFTVNAMAVPLASWLTATWKKKIIDPHQGCHDLLKKILSPVSNQILAEDPLRLLRAFRLSAELGFSISPSLMRMIKKNKNRIKKPASERIREELLKLFSVETSHQTLHLMDQSGLLDVLLPECKKLRKTGQSYYGKGGVLKHTLDSLMLLEEILKTRASWFPRCHQKISSYLNEKISGYPRFAHLKWGVLLHDVGKPETAKFMDGRLRFFEHEHVGAAKVPRIAKRFRWSSQETDHYTRLVKNHMRPGNLATHEDVSDKAIHRFFRDLGDDAIAMLLVSLGDHLSYLTPKERKSRTSSHERLTKTMVNKYYLKRAKVLPARILNGHDVMKEFKLKPSPLIGELLRDLMDAQSEGKIKSKEQALDYLKSQLPKHVSIK